VAGGSRRVRAAAWVSFGEGEKKLLELDVRINAQGLAHAADAMRASDE
jgi:hypothetical protein